MDSIIKIWIVSVLLIVFQDIFAWIFYRVSHIYFMAVDTFFFFLNLFIEVPSYIIWIYSFFPFAFVIIWAYRTFK